MAAAGNSGMMAQARTFWAGLSAGKRIALIAVVLAGAGGAAALASLSGKIEYAPLFASLPEDDMAAIAAKLKEKKIAYQLEGKTILVPADKVASIRLDLTAEQLPKGGGAGFELFDKRTLGMSEFTQQLNFRRALEGELSRTIRSLGAVEAVRVHLVVPKRSLFIERGQPASASVVLKLRAALQPSQVRAIVHLVSASVEGLSTEHVTVVDGDGRLLWKGRGEESDAIGEGSSDKDRQLERRTVAMLEAVVGSGKALVTVATDLETKQEEKTIEAYDPESRVVRSEQETKDVVATGAAVGAAGGLPGARANLPSSAPTPAGGASAPQGSSRQSALKNYELTKTVSRVIDRAGRVKKRSVAVIVDGKYEDKDGKRVFVARTVDELKNLEEIVRSAVGFQQDRGDVVTVRSIAFELPKDPAAGAPVPELAGAPAWHQYAKWGGVGLAVLLFLLVVVRPVMKAIAPPPAPVELASKDAEAAALALGDGAPMSTIAALAAARGETIDLGTLTPREEAARVVTGDPRRAAQVIRAWLTEKSASGAEKAA